MVEIEITGKVAGNIIGILNQGKEKQKGEEFARTFKKLFAKLNGVIPESEVQKFIDSVEPPKGDQETLKVNLKVKELQKIDIERFDEVKKIDIEFAEYLKIKKAIEEFEYEPVKSEVMTHLFDFVNELKEKVEEKK